VTAKKTNITSPACKGFIPQAGVNPWLKLIMGIILILTFIFGIGSLAQLIPGARHMAYVIDEGNIRATAVYYTDFEEPATGSEIIRDRLDYLPGFKP